MVSFVKFHSGSTTRLTPSRLAMSSPLGSVLCDAQGASPYPNHDHRSVASHPRLAIIQSRYPP
ncbi:hypothetical protein BGY98DRAFT_975449 [Russula aff. rugulosa BPL654]|nr:hypothetical protein BGY98DRAFT_975449 [Russula aff. rugulosa BPL654]